MSELFGVKYDSSEEKEPKKPLISRRTALKAILGGGATVATGVTFPTGIDYVEEKIRPEALKKEIAKKLLFLENQYGLMVNGTFVDSEVLSGARKMVDALMNVQYNEASLVKINRALGYLIKEFSKYPSSFIKNLHIPSINIVDSLVAEGDPTTIGTTSRKESGLENYINLEISSGILDKDKDFGWSEEGPFKKTIHHELFHVIFNLIDDSSRHLFSEHWVSLYDPEDYGKIRPYKDRLGFISEYGQESSSEDFSETASAMMNNSENIFDKIEKDPKLKRKVDFLKELMFYRSFGLCNREYWDLLRKGKLSLDFFKKRKAYLLSLNLEQLNKELKLNNLKNIDLFTFGQKELLTDEGVFELFRKNLTEMQI
jgi:hypothetical protein